MPYVILGNARKGRWAGQLVIIGSIRENSLANGLKEAESYMARARAMFLSRPDPDIDPDSLRIAKVTDPNNEYIDL